MAEQGDRDGSDDCKVCKKFFTSKNPNFNMTDEEHTVIKCMASDVDSSNSCSDKGQGHLDTATKNRGHETSVKFIEEKPIPKSRLSIKNKNVAEILSYDSSDGSEKYQGQRLDNLKVKDQIVHHNLATKPPKVKSVKSSSSAMMISEVKKAKSNHKIKLSTSENDKIEKEIQAKIANRSHLQHIIDEAMDHFQKLSSKSTHDHVKENRTGKLDIEDNNKKDQDFRPPVCDNIQDAHITNVEAIETDKDKWIKDDIPANIFEHSGEFERTSTPDRPSSRENMISPSRRALMSPNGEPRSSPNGSVSGSRRKLPQPPGHKLRCSITSVVYSSIESDSSRPNSSADFSDASDCSSKSRCDNTNVLRDENYAGKVSPQKLGFEGSNLTTSLDVQVVKDGKVKESQNSLNGTKISDKTNAKLQSILTKANNQHGFIKMVQDTDRNECKVTIKNTNESLKNELVYSENKSKINKFDCVLSESRTTTPDDKLDNNHGALDISATSSSDGISASDYLDISTDKLDQCSSDNVGAITGNHSQGGNENDLMLLKQKQVSRSPSYRKKVMAKARSRYHRQLKELKCKTGECNGNCSICGSQNSEKITRSQTSLGVPVESINEEDYLEHSSPRRVLTPDLLNSPLINSTSSHRSLKRVPVSSRVDLLMSNSLFKKHLSKHEDLLQKHTLSYRKFGLQKAVSNLDLSDGTLFDDLSISEKLQDQEENILNSSSKLSSGHPRHTSRRYSLSGENDIPEFVSKPDLAGYEEKKTLVTIPSLDEYRASNKSRQTQVPTFAEFRQNKSQKRRVLPSFTDIRSSYNNSSQTLEKVNQNESGNVNTSKFPDKRHIVKNNVDKSSLRKVSEVSEITGSVGHLETESESIPQVNEPKAVIAEHISSENKASVIIDRNSGSKHNEAMHNKHAKTAENNIAALGSSLYTIGKLDSDFMGESLKSEDTSPLSTSELDSTEINPQRRAHLETEWVGSQEVSCCDLSSSEITNRSDSKSAMKERHRKGAKRPRSLISKKSSLAALIKESKQTENFATSADGLAAIKRENSLNTALKKDKKHNVHFSDEGSRSDSFRSVKSEGHSPRRRRNEIQPILNKVDHATGHAKGSHFGAKEGNNNIMFTLENDHLSEASQDARGTESEVASLLGSAASESLNSEISGLQDDDGAVFCQTFEFEDQDDVSGMLKSTKDDSSAPVLRSTSDACDATPEALKKRRERKERPYKSDPFSGTEIIPASKRYYIREERARLGQHRNFANSSREEVLDFLDVVNGQVKVPDSESFPSLEELNEDDEQVTRTTIRTRMSSKLGEIRPQTVELAAFERLKKSPYTDNRDTVVDTLENLSVSDAVSNHSKNIRNITRSASSASTDSGVIGQEESHDSQQSSPSNTLTKCQRSSWSEFRHVAAGPPQLSASCSDLSKAEMEGCLDCDYSRKLDMQNVLQICSRCYQRRVERKKTIQEIIETEVNYGRDLTILKEEFYEPMRRTNLLNKDQLDSIFLNLDELIHVNTYFLGKLKAAVNTANHSNDEDLQEVRIGSLFLESSSMFLTFENYCVNQAQAPVLLEQLEREKELLRIFLHVSQSDNHLLRRMHLKSFLMVPVQRIMKYPLLLDRLYKATLSKNEDKESIREAKEKIEDILGHINAKSKVSSTGSIKQSQKRKLSERHCSMTEKIEVLRVALESLGWSRKDVCDVITSRLQLAVPVDHLWASKKCKNLKFTPALGVLLTLGEPLFEQSDKNLVFPSNSAVRSAAVVLIREKNGKYQVMRDPLMLEKCVVSQDPEFTEVFEVLEWSKESLLMKADSQKETNQWVLYLRQQMQQLGCWRKRRNALPNILLNHLSQ